MRTALLALIGFTAFTLCPSMCPAQAEMAATQDHSMHHDMHADAGHEHHDHEESPCDHCEANAQVELALSQGSQVMEVPVAVFTFIALQPQVPVERIQAGLPRSHLAAAGPPVAPEIVSTVVLRT